MLCLPKTINKLLTAITLIIILLLSSCTKDEPTILDELVSEKSWVLESGYSFVEFNYDSNVFVQASLVNNGECYFVFDGADYGYVVTVITNNESLLELSIEDSGSTFTRMIYRNDNGDMVWKSLYINGSVVSTTIITPSTIDFNKVKLCK